MKCKCENEMETIITDYEFQGIKLENVKINKCSNCGNTLLSEEVLMKLSSKIEENTIERLKSNLRNSKLEVNLKDLRKKTKFKQKDIAEILETTPARYNKIEKDGSNVTIKRALELAHILGCDVNEIYKLVFEE